MHELKCACGTSQPDKAHCLLCHENLDDLVAVVDHIRLLHPHQFEPPEQWPDGGLVIEDDPDMADLQSPQQVPAQDVAWTCPDCGYPGNYTILWYTLEPATITCGGCCTATAVIQPPRL